MATETLDQTLDTLKQEAIDYVQLQMGQGIIDVELDAAHYESAYQRALGVYRQRAENAFEESYNFLKLQDGVNVYTLPSEIQTVRQVFRRTIGWDNGGELRDGIRLAGAPVATMLPRIGRPLTAAPGASVTLAGLRFEAVEAGGAGFAGVSIKEKHGGLVICQPLVHVARPIAPGFQSQSQTGAIKARFEPIESVGVANRFADYGKIIGIPARHGSKDLFYRLKTLGATQQGGDFFFRNDNHCFTPSSKKMAGQLG